VKTMLETLRHGDRLGLNSILLSDIFQRNWW